MSVLEARNVHRDFTSQGKRTKALGGIDLVVAQGEVVVLLGASGAGKTTLLRILAGLDHPTLGTVTLGGTPVEGPNPALGFVFQEPRLLPWLTVAQNVAFALHRDGGKAKHPERVRAQLAKVGLEARADAYPHQLSGGMAQRVALARALVNGPRILLLDEPLGALDPQIRADLQREILGLVASLGCTTVLVTHDLDEAVMMGSRVLVLSGPPSTIQTEVTLGLSHPRDRRSAEFHEARQALAAAMNEPSSIRPSPLRGVS